MNEDHKQKDQPRPHSFDEIQEYDNDLPRWWVGMFWITIVFAVIYMIWYHTPIGRGLTQEEEFKQELAEANQNAAKAPVTAFDYVSAAKDAATVASGKEAFTQTCLPCHGANGQGVVGPNLTDNFWIYGATFAALEDVITKGRSEKGMPAWGEVLGRQKIQQVIAFIASIQGTNPPEAKAAQGEPGSLK